MNFCYLADPQKWDAPNDYKHLTDSFYECHNPCMTKQDKFGWLILPLALAIDFLLGDPTNRWHPVAWMGSAIAYLQRNAPKQGRLAQFIYGGFVAIGGVTVCATIVRYLLVVGTILPRPLQLLLQALLLKMTFSLSGLVKAGQAVEQPLSDGDLDQARQQLSWHLVSRETAQLDEAQVAAATIESLAENTSDSVIAPLFFYLLGGLPAAYGYRFLNTADAMVGYRDEAREWLGKATARLDDLANIIPARLTALLMIGCAPSVKGDSANGWRIWRRDAATTDSPNAGHPMAAAAGVLEVELDKVEQYTLGEGQKAARWQDIRRAIQLIQIVAVVAVLMGTAVQFWRSKK